MSGSIRTPRCWRSGGCLIRRPGWRGSATRWSRRWGTGWRWSSHSRHFSSVSVLPESPYWSRQSDSLGRRAHSCCWTSNGVTSARPPGLRRGVSRSGEPAVRRRHHGQSLPGLRSLGPILDRGAGPRRRGVRAGADLEPGGRRRCSRPHGRTVVRCAQTIVDEVAARQRGAPSLGDVGVVIGATTAGARTRPEPTQRARAGAGPGRPGWHGRRTSRMVFAGARVGAAVVLAGASASRPDVQRLRQAANESHDACRNVLKYADL